jgi:DNA-binding transcriptional MerR regulator
MKQGNVFPIGHVSKATGLSPHVIRVWERRYGMICPQRSGTGRRLYCPQDIERLALAQKAVAAGQRISLIARMDIAELKAVVEAGSPGRSMLLPHEAATEQSTDTGLYLNDGLAAVMGLDQAALDQRLRQAAVALPKPVLLTAVISPLLERIGALWEDGAIRIINEHMATTVIQRLLWDLLKQAPAGQGAPAMVVATPCGQLCEMGALMAAVVGADGGWDVNYFGANLPCQEIAAAVFQKNARAVALSVAFRSDPVWLIRELEQLAAILPAGVATFIGGRGIDGYHLRLTACGFKCPHDLDAFAKAIAGPTIS